MNIFGGQSQNVKNEIKKKNVWKSDKSWEPEKIWKFENFWKFEKIWKFEILKFKIAQVDPRDILKFFCFHVWAQKSL